MNYSVTQEDFSSRNTRCAGELFVPENVDKPPVVIMAHGFGGEKAFGLLPFAKRFMAQGLAVFLFDYRTFAKSDGLPRNLVSPRAHLEDWKAAIKHVRTLESIDTHTIGLWGTSFSGGHVLVTAARDNHVKAVVSQVPFTDGFSLFSSLPIGYFAKALAPTIQDCLAVFLKKPPFYIPVAAEPETFAALNQPGCLAGYESVVGKENRHLWENRCPARILLQAPLYRPVSYASKITCPVLMVVGEKDNVCSPEAAYKTFSRLKNGFLEKLPVGHFDIYTGKNFEKTAEKEASFFKKQLLDR